MKLNDLTNLVHLRRFLYEIQNGYGSLSKEDSKGLNAKIREIDSIVVKATLSTDFKNLAAQAEAGAAFQASSTEDDFEKSSKMVLEDRKKEGANQAPSNSEGAEEEKFTKLEKNLLKDIVSEVSVGNEIKKEEVSKEIKKSLTKKKSGSFNRSE